VQPGQIRIFPFGYLPRSPFVGLTLNASSFLLLLFLLTSSFTIALSVCGFA
jgi:hypothetical protein